MSDVNIQTGYLEEPAYSAFRELEAKLQDSKAPGKRTKTVRRKKKYVSPRRRDKYVPKEVECVECKLPSAKNLPPLVGVNRLIEGEVVRVLRHEMCPSDAEGIKALVLAQRKFRLDRWNEFRKPLGRVYSTHVVDGKPVRTLVA